MPIENTTDVVQLAVEVLEGRPSPEALAWLRDAFRLWLSGADLTHGLGLAGAHSRGPRYAVRRRLQLAALQAAAATIPAASAWARSKLLAAEIRAFPRKRHRPPRNDLEAALARAFEFGPPPSSTPAVHAALNAPHPSD